MPADTLMIAADWYGPFSSLRAARLECERTNVAECLYLAIFDDDDGSYVGISSSVSTRLTSSHHVLHGIIDGGAQVWIGIISSQAVPGRRPAAGYVSHSESAHVAEHLTAYLLELSENRSKRKRPPGRTAVLFNRWFDCAEPYTRKRRRGHPDWPDLIEYDADLVNARLVWFGSKCKVYSADEVMGLKLVD